MRNIWVAMLMLTSFAVTGSDEKDRGRDAAASVMQRFGSGESLQTNAFEPMSSDKPMTTVDGETFDVQFECKAEPGFMQVTIGATEDNDVSNVVVSLDRDLDGQQDYTHNYSGPFAAICTNGLMRCAPGTTDNCVGAQWRPEEDGLALDAVPATEVGGCYCVNNSCGAGLLQTNRDKVLDDIGTGAARALQETNPRLAVGHARRTGDYTMEFYGQQSGCGYDNEPEQYYHDPERLREDGQEANDDPDARYAWLRDSPAANNQSYSQSDCKIVRNITLKNSFKHGTVLSFGPTEYFESTECGPRCRNYRLGNPVNNNLSGWCERRDDSVQIDVLKPELIESATLTFVGYDDWFAVRFNGELAFSKGWDGLNPTNRCGENKKNYAYALSVDVTHHFLNSPTVLWHNMLSYSGKGQGYSRMQIHFKDDCELDDEYIDDACAGFASDNNCELKDETVDDVQTVEDYYKSELTPLPSERTFTVNSCSQTYTRDWWNIDRTYVCKSGDPAYDGEYAAERYENIHNSYDADSGEFQDRREGEDGEYQAYSMNSPQPPPDENGCVAMCKTRSPRPGETMGSDGSVGKQSKDGVAWDHHFYECTTDNVCPIGDGEELVSDCNCNGNFVEAFTTMQTIRMMQQDTICQ